LEEVTREGLERARQQSAALARESLSALTEQTRDHGQAALAEVRATADQMLNEISAHAAARLAQARSEVHQQAENFSARLREIMASEEQEAAAAARREIAILQDAALAHIREETRARHDQLEQDLAGMSDEAIEAYRKRLETASSSWLLTTATRLDQQSEQLIESVARMAEERLRETFTRVLAEAGENIRRQLLGAVPANAKGAAASK
jgi:hypothetical protein